MDMPEMPDTTAWSCLLLGLYTLFAGVGALRQPSLWGRMIEEVRASPALQLVSALLELVVGSLIYLANPWVPADLLACVAKFIGGCMMIEGLVIAGFCDIYSTFWLNNLAHQNRGWALFAVVMGLALAVPAMFRFQ
jgi:hypothetical protein